MFKRIIVIPLIALSLLACSEQVQEAKPIDLSPIYQTRDTLALSELIDEKHLVLRKTLSTQLKHYLRLRVDSTQAAVDSLWAELNWLLPTYTNLTECTDLLGMSDLYQNWSDSQIHARFKLDSNLSGIFASRHSMNLDTLLVRLQRLKPQYESLGDYYRSAYLGYLQAEGCEIRNKLSIALPYTKQALLVCQTINDYETEAKLQLILSKFYITCEFDYHKSEKALTRGFECVEQIDDYVGRAYYYKFQAFNFMLSFVTRKALERYNNALKEFSRAENNTQIAECNYFIGENYYYMNKYDSAIYYGNIALEQRRKLAVGDSTQLSKIGISLSNLGLYLAALGDTAQALEQFDQAEEILEHSSDEKAVCINRIHKALILVNLDRIAEARELLNYALNNTQRFEDRTMTLFGLVLCDYYELKQNAALSKLRLCITRLETSRDNIPITDYKNGMLSDKIGFYHLASNIFIDRFNITNNYDELDSAFFYLERSKAKTLNDMLVASNTKDPTSELLYDSLIAMISDCENKLLDNNNADLALRTEIQRLTRLLHTSRIENTDLSSDINLDMNYDFPSLYETQQVLANDEILLEYMISEFGSWVFAIDKESKGVAKLNMDARRINELTEQYCNAINRRPQDNRMPDSCIEKGKELYSTLFPPEIEKQIEGKHITIVASDKLHYLPFESLIDGSGRYLVEHHDISYTPSVTVRKQLELREIKPSHNIYAFGNPSYSTSSLDPLPYSGDEVDCIAEIFGSQQTNVFKGADATETKFRQLDYTNTSVLHIATHGITDEYRPEKSALIFAAEDSSDGHSMLHSEEIARLNIPVDLVFLSACRSGTGGSFPGEGVLSLCQPFLVAGSNSVIVSYWNINDLCSVDMVKSFYNYRKKGHSKAQSLARAKRDMLHHKRTAWNHPYFWAPFVLVGLDN